MVFPNYKNSNLDNPLFSDLKKQLGTSLIGTVPNTSIKWLAAVEIELSRKLSGFFMLVTPTIITTKSEIEADRHKVAPFIKEATARWYNTKFDNILEAWLDIFFQGNEEISISAFETDIQGVDASFKLLRKSPYTKKM